MTIEERFREWWADKPQLTTELYDQTPLFAAKEAYEAGFREACKWFAEEIRKRAAIYHVAQAEYHALVDLFDVANAGPATGSPE